MKPIFTILWIEDKDFVITSQIPTIQKFLDESGYELKLMKDNEGDKYKGILENEPIIDVIVTDYNISEDVKGIDVVKFVREKKKLTDILFYSVVDDIFKKGKIFSDMGHFGLVQICQGKDVEKPLKELIQKNLQRLEDIVFLRGFVISRSVDLEIKMNDVFSCYFKINPDLKEDFHNFILESSYVPFFGKSKWLSQILKKKGFTNDPELIGLLTQVQWIAEQRNLLAHCKRDTKIPNILVSSGKTEVFDKNRVNEILIKIAACESKIEKLIAKCNN
jgi:hypothetical protein